MLIANCLRPGESLLVALSGGADSVALLAAIVEAGHPCRALHCNYHLRGDESDRDERHAREVCRQLGVEIDIVHCDVEEYRRTRPGTSVEMACRDLRYEAFNQALERYRLDSVAIGHHLEDNIETMMLNMLRGSGVKGLAAMRPRRGRCVRPLLEWTKADILDYLASHGLTYVTDSSNLGNDYRRNALRNEILPLINRYFPSSTTGLSNTLAAIASQRDILEDTIDRLADHYVDSTGRIDLRAIVANERHPQSVLFELLNRPDYRGYNMTIVCGMIDGADKSGLSFNGSDGTSYALDYGRLMPVELSNGSNDETTTLDLDNIDSFKCYFDIQIIEKKDFKPERDNTRAYFDIDKLRGFKEIVLRHPRRGDRLKPWGMNGSRLLSDIFTDLHYDRCQRQSARVLEADGELLWLVGIRASRIAAVTPSTRHILVLTDSRSPARPDKHRGRE